MFAKLNAICGGNLIILGDFLDGFLVISAGFGCAASSRFQTVFDLENVGLGVFQRIDPSEAMANKAGDLLFERGMRREREEIKSLEMRTLSAAQPMM